MMSPADVVRFLRQLRYRPNTGDRLGLAFIASRAGVHRQTLYDVIDSGTISPSLAGKVARVVFKSGDIASKNGPAVVFEPGGPGRRPQAATRELEAGARGGSAGAKPRSKPKYQASTMG